MPNPLNAIERRVVGVLVEKLLATPQSYPLTINALLAGCNQKNNRDPEMDLGEADVRQALAALQQEGHIVSVFAEGQRVEKFKTTAKDKFQLPSERAMAVFAELLIRGPQTQAELRARASRMRHELTQEDIVAVLADFTGRPDPLAVNIGRAPGRRAERYAHTLYPEGEKPTAATAAPAAAPRAAGPAAEEAPGGAGRLEEALREVAALRERVEALERAVDELRGR